MSKVTALNSDGDPRHDPRMRGFRTRVSVEEFVALVDASGRLAEPERVALREAYDRVLAEHVEAECDVPGFDRAAMDGYAVHGEETFGADVYAPARLRVIGQCRPGSRFERAVGAAEAVEIATGAPMPAGADTVVKVEATAREGDWVLVKEAFPPGRHVGHRGEDVTSGQVVLPAGRVLRPQDLGVLSVLGKSYVPVLRKPRVSVIVTGDELLEAGQCADGVRFADANSPMLEALIRRDGGTPQVLGPLRDDRNLLTDTIRACSATSDVLLISGGSSTGPEDHAPTIVAELGQMQAHGVALRPASPTGVGVVEGVPVLLLPGNPVSCLCAYDLFAGRLIRRLGGRRLEWPYQRVVMPLGEKLVSALGRVDYARVVLEDGSAVPIAVSGASILTSTTRADGFVLVPANLEGYPAGAQVTVWLYDEELA